MREGPTIALPARQLFEVPADGAVRILCTAGCLWLTLDGEPRDVVLNPGDAFEAGERRALLYAFERSAFTLLAPAQGTMRRRLAKNRSDCSRSPIVWAATRAASSG